MPEKKTLNKRKRERTHKAKKEAGSVWQVEWHASSPWTKKIVGR
jgi:hypothetical protein